MKTIIHVNQAHIRSNRKVNPNERIPVLTVKTYKTNTYCNSVQIKGPSNSATYNLKLNIDSTGKAIEKTVGPTAPEELKWPINGADKAVHDFPPGLIPASELSSDEVATLRHGD